MTRSDYTVKVSNAETSPNREHEPSTFAIAAAEKVRAKLAHMKARGLYVR